MYPDWGKAGKGAWFVLPQLHTKRGLGTSIARLQVNQKHRSDVSLSEDVESPLSLGPRACRREPGGAHGHCDTRTEHATDAQDHGEPDRPHRPRWSRDAVGMSGPYRTRHRR